MSLQGFWMCPALVLILVFGMVTYGHLPLTIGLDDIVAVHPETEDLYIATECSIIHRSKASNFTVINNVFLNSSGIQNCSKSNGKKKATALGLNPNNSTLMVCWSYSNGLCEMYNSSNITQPLYTINSGVLYTKRSAVVFVDDNTVLVGSSSSPPVIALQTLYPHNSTSSEIDGKSMTYPAACNSTVTFLTGFQLNDHVFFLTVQGDDKNKNTTLLRVKVDTDSLMEIKGISLRCYKHDLGKPVDVQLTRAGDSLFVSYGQRKSDPTDALSLCQYDLTKLNKKMDESPALTCSTSDSPNRCTLFNMTCNTEGSDDRTSTTRGSIFQYKLANRTSRDKCPVNDPPLYILFHSNVSHKVISRYGGPYRCEDCKKNNSTDTLFYWCKGHCGNNRCSNSCLFDDYHPKRGLKSGGTVVSFCGCNVQILQDKKLQLNGTKCFYIKNQTSSSTYKCRLDKYKIHKKNSNTGTGKENLDTNADREKIFPNCKGTFIFEDDPNITEIQPKKLFESSNTTLNISGLRFDLIENITMKLMYNDTNSTISTDHTCIKKNASFMSCPTSVLGSNLDFPVTVDLMFQMDNVTIARFIKVVVMIRL